MAPNEKSPSTDTENPNENLKIPSWITQDYFEDIVKQDVKDFVKIVKFTPVAGSAVGDNYASIMLRVLIDVELKDKSTKHISYMLKTAHDKESESGGMIDKMRLFPKENEMYNFLLPAFEKLYRDQGKVVTFGPKSYKFTKDPGVDNVLLEDLRLRNFRNCDRLVGLDVEHAKSVLKILAELHAASAVYFEQNGKYEDYFTKGMFVEENRPLFELMNNSMKDIHSKCICKWKNGDVYWKKLEEPMYGKAAIDRILKHGEVDYDDFNVLNHGDLWVNNIMFRYNDSGALAETCLIDFQIGKYGPPVQDLYYFLISSVQLDVKFTHFDAFIKFYHDNLIENLKLLKYPKPLPTLRNLHISLLKSGQWALMTGFGVLTAILMDPDENANMENLVQDNDAATRMKTLMFTNPRYVRAMEDIMEWMDNRGILEC